MNKTAMDERTFKKIFMKCLDDISTYVDSDLVQVMARHNIGYGRVGFNLIKYYRIEYKKYFAAYQKIVKYVPEKGKICDCGGFLGVFAYVLSQIGYKVSIIEALKYYENSFEPLYDFLREKGIEVIDFDMFDKEGVIENWYGAFDIVCAMDIIEHYPYSLRYFIDNMKLLAKSDGYLFLTAPNIAVFHKRWSFFVAGISPLASIEEIYKSEIPYTGHCHEMTMVELEKLAELSKLKIVVKDWNSCYYYGEGIRNSIYKLIHKCFPNTRENLEILLQK